MTENQKTILEALGVGVNAHLRYTESELVQLARASVAHYADKYSMPWIVEYALKNCDTALKLQDLCLDIEQVKRWHQSQAEHRITQQLTLF